MEKQKNKILTYEDLRAKPGYATTGFVEWADEVLERTPNNDFILPINKKLETSSPATKELVMHIEKELIKYGEIVKSFYYGCGLVDNATYLLKTPDCWHELVFSDFQKYSEGQNEGDSRLLLRPDVFIMKPELNRTPEEYKLDQIFFESFKKKDSSRGFSAGKYSSNRTFTSHLLGETKDKEESSEIISVIPCYEKFVRNQDNQYRVRNIRSIDIDLGDIRDEFRIMLDERISPLIKKENDLYNELEIRLDEK